MWLSCVFAVFFPGSGGDFWWSWVIFMDVVELCFGRGYVHGFGLVVDG